MVGRKFRAQNSTINHLGFHDVQISIFAMDNIATARTTRIAHSINSGDGFGRGRCGRRSQHEIPFTICKRFFYGRRLVSPTTAGARPNVVRHQHRRRRHRHRCRLSDGGTGISISTSISTTILITVIADNNNNNTSIITLLLLLGTTTISVSRAQKSLLGQPRSSSSCNNNSEWQCYFRHSG